MYATVYLTRRNLLTLLNKLDRNLSASGPRSACTIVKHDIVHPKYPCSLATQVIALENDEYYTDREPGYVQDAPTGD